MDRAEFFAKLPRSEPGGVTFTNAYLTSVQIKAVDRVCVMGAGPGDLPVWVARSRGCRVVALDADRACLLDVCRRAEEGGARGLVRCIHGDYRNPPFPDHAFRALVAEGTAMALGLKQALTLWRRLVVPEGHLTLTYPGVVNKDAPPEVRGPLEKRMAEPMSTLAEYHATVRAAGFEIVHQVPLHPDLWEGFYTDAVRHAWALVAAREGREDDPVLRGVLNEAHWFRTVGRSRVFMQAMVLRRVR